MIGGTDIFIPNPMSIDCALQMVHRYLERLFPSSVFEDEPDHEFLMYHDQASKDAWDEHGLNEEHANRMWYFIFQEKEVTMVVHEVTDEIQKAIDEIRNILRMNSCY